MVAEPQAQASIDTIALYLQYREPCREDLTMIRDAIEIDNVVKVVARHDAPEVRGVPRQPTPDDRAGRR